MAEANNGLKQEQELVEPSSVQVDQNENSERVELGDNDTVENSPTDQSSTEVGRKDKFVDGPDELIVSDNRGVAKFEETKQNSKDNDDTKEANVRELISDNSGIVTIEETKQSLEDNDDTKEADVHESDNGIQDDVKEAHVYELVSDNSGIVIIEDTKQSLDESDDRKEAHAHELDNGTQEGVMVHSPKEFKDDKESLQKVFADLRYQLKALSYQKPLNIENEELEEMEKSISIHDAANKCSMLVKNVVKERLHMEGELKKLQSSVILKDQDIEGLHLKISELSVSQNVVLSFFSSQNSNLSDLSNPSTEVQYGLQSIDDCINKMLASLAPTVDADGLSDESISGRLSFVEQNVSQVIGNYQYLLSEIELLRQCLTEVSSDFNVEEDKGTTTAVARNVLLELKRKEVDFGQHISTLEEENKKMNADIEKLQEELEQEKTRYVNTKEKLSMAVTKGKALVQQKDSLKQSLAEKTIEIEKCLAEFEEKTRALEAMDLVKEELVKAKNLAASLQDTVSERDIILSKCEEILSQTSVNRELESDDIMERIRCLVDEKNTLAGVMLEYNKLEDVVSSIDFPEDVSSSDIESRVSWLVESFSLSKSELGELQDEIARSSEVARDKIESLTVSLLDETQEKNFIREELECLTLKYQEIVEKESQLLVEKDRVVSFLLEASGTEIDKREEAVQPGSDMGLLIDRCINKIKTCSPSYKSSGPRDDIFENLQTHLYIKDQELMLCEELLEEDTHVRLKVATLENELRTVSQELQVLKDEKSALERDLENSDEKTSLLREKLSMAVKKGKGLAQDRENLKKIMDEKTSEIEKLKHELQQQESSLDDFKNQIDKLLANVELIPKLEADITTMKDQKDQLEQFLAESNNMMQRVMESIDGIVLPVDVIFEKPVDKVLWLVSYLNECQDVKTFAEKELDNLKVEFDSLTSKLTEAYTAKSSLEESLSTAENNISQLHEEKRELSEICATRKLLEDALSKAESKISVLIIEKDDAQLSKSAVETELEKVKEEVSTQTTRLAEAYTTINSLQDALSHLETNVSLLSKENNDFKVDRSNLEDEMKKLKEEAESQSSKFLDATSTIRSLEDNISLLVGEKENVEEEVSMLKEEAESHSSKLLDATSTIRSLEDNVSKLGGEMKNAEEEISLLHSKLNACMEELSGLGGSSENRSMELFSHLNNLQLLSKEETLSSLLRQSFEVKFQRLRDIDLLLRDINGYLVQMGSDSFPTSIAVEEDSDDNIFSAGFDNFANGEIDKSESNAEGGDSFESHLRNAVEGISSRNRILFDKFRGCSTSMDEFLASLLKNFQRAREEIVCKLDQVRSLEQNVNDLETGRDRQKLAIASLEKDVKVLFSACTITAQELENEVENYQVELSSIPDPEKWTDLLSEVKEVKPAENLLMAAQKVCALTRQLERERNDSADVTKVLESKMTETKAAAENAIEERDLLQAKISELENDLGVLRSSHQEIRYQVENYQEKETISSGQDAELSSLRESLAKKKKEAEDALLVASQVKYVYDKINDLEILSPEFNVGDTEIHDLDHVKKLSYVIEAVMSMQGKMSTLSQDKEKLQLTVETQGHHIKNLEEKIEKQGREEEDLKKMKNEMFAIELGITNIIHKLGSNDLVRDQKSDGVKGLFTVLEKLVSAIILEYDNTKSRAQELGVKLHGSQKVVDELSGKIKSLGTTTQGRSPSSDGERSIFEAPPLPTRSEITELEDVGPVGKKAAGSSPSAPHARPLRKGSTDHLAINIDSESDRLIKDEESDEDKGKVFKSLNTSGLIPIQGKMLADRVDGFWLSGDRALMGRPRVRLGLIAYWLLLHLWLLGTIL